MPEGLRRQLLSAAFETADAVKASFEDDAVRLARKPRLRTTTRLYMLERVALVRWKAARDNARERRWNSLSREMVPKSLSRYNTHIYTGNETLSLSLVVVVVCVPRVFFFQGGEKGFKELCCISRFTKVEATGVLGPVSLAARAAAAVQVLHVDVSGLVADRHAAHRRRADRLQHGGRRVQRQQLRPRTRGRKSGQSAPQGRAETQHARGDGRRSHGAAQGHHAGRHLQSARSPQASPRWSRAVIRDRGIITWCWETLFSDKGANTLELEWCRRRAKVHGIYREALTLLKKGP